MAKFYVKQSEHKSTKFINYSYSRSGTPSTDQADSYLRFGNVVLRTIHEGVLYGSCL